jgi:asparagine synthase (glutamine-hydrolysing)
MADESNRFVIVFNGEIFNYKELRKKLEDKGISFFSGSDTEVLLKLYIHKGENCLQDLVGFFAFAIYDKEENSLFIARDRLGIKPLFYYQDEDKLLFASELKSLLAFNIERELDYTSLYTYFQLNYVPGPNTIFKNIFKLSPGNYLKIKNKEVIERNYYTVPFDPDHLSLDSYEIQKRKLVELMDESVRLRLIADVPLGVFLSGGIDSSVVTALAARHKEKIDTFSIGFKDEPFMDETHYAKLVADKYSTNHTVFSLDSEDYEENIFEVLDYLDEPFADSSCIPTYILSKMVRQRVKVALSGDGGDELFAGYNKHRAEYILRNGNFGVSMISMLGPLWKALPKSNSSPIQNLIRQFDKFASSKSLSEDQRYWNWCGHMQEKELKKLCNAFFQKKVSPDDFNSRKSRILRFLQGRGDLNAVLRTDIELVLDNNMLVKTDRMSMANSLEVRVPFLDHRVVNFAFTLPESSKIDKSRKKKIVQDAFRDFLPAELYNRPKRGFDVPLMKFYKTSLKKLIRDQLLDESFIREQNIFNPDEVKKVKHQLFGKGYVNQEKIWALIVFQYWYRKYII